MLKIATRLTWGLVALLLATPLRAQPLASTSETLDISAVQASTWQDDQTHVLLLRGPVRITVAGATLQADNGAIWLTPIDTGILDAHQAQIALLGNATILQGDVQRSGENLVATVAVRGRVRITAEQRLSRNEADTDLYRQALDLRAQATAPVPAGTTPALPATTQPTADTLLQPLPPPSGRLRIAARGFETERTADGRIAMVFTDHVLLTQERENGDFIELQAERAVLFTQLQSLRQLEDSDQFERIEDAVESAYLEGDVQINYTRGTGHAAEQRLRADRVFYELTTDRAVLTDAVLHARDPQRPLPVVVRAQTIRQLALGELEADRVQLTTSAFATPSYAIAADRAYVRRVESDDPRVGSRYVFTSSHSTLQTFGVPVFYLPYISGSVTQRGIPLRDLNIGNNNRFGFFVQTDWGLFETLGKAPREDLDIVYKLDYYSDRGPAGGIDASYRGGFIRPTTRDPWTFEGNVTSFFIHDSGEDDFGGIRADEEPEDAFRGRILWEHQHFFPDDWQLQARAGWVSDANFLEQWFRTEWEQNREHDLSLYVKRQRNTEALTFLIDAQPNDIVTISDLAQEQFEVERLPEIGYHRIGDSFAADTFTFFSRNTASALQFEVSDTPLSDQGYYGAFTPGMPSLGLTGVTDDTIYRADFRQEIDYPFAIGQVRFVPFVMGRYTFYSDSPQDDRQNRVLAGAGIRMTTAFWSVDNGIFSELLDIHRVRHVIEPEIELFTSAASVDAHELFIFDEDVDRVYDLSAARIGVRQRWQTQRGGPGRWRSVDFFVLNVFGNFFANKPDDIFRDPQAFRGIYFSSLPEASIPRNSINVDAMWRISDTTAILSDASYNLEEGELATAAVGFAVRRELRLSYFVGLRYINVIDSTIATLAASYELTPKYMVAVSTSFGLDEDDDRFSATGTIIRRFDRFHAALSIYYDEVDDLGGLNLTIVPYGFAPVLGANVERAATR